ncbi:hypothetical protein PRLR5107_10800 [Prevotella lacticifex]|jgi:hypothetical protein|uniref:Uncharacterized protein n=2 Tax=Prevotella lacticifex TaxID=2854755 RepID=A0A9R1CY10_9BACT|nr:hypothetical protein PRLR5003_05210 [Prevotella lacticifex]GJG39585.1 hypothetical protein PRLR5019_15560 [Prevotella lacticifex]GJG41733.1 hypothetical protein PRLR5025_05190 [Prevotella lacticifex]GJG45942.1 hypothetical protein PRLR5027_15370 [Prevotella lacticifex]GJG48084.1 hypothetical protein PRLR5052_04970 [Prevotella lacticifex]
MAGGARRLKNMFNTPISPFANMEIKINKKGNKMLLKADDGEELIIAPRHLPSIRRTPYEIACDEFELTIETYKSKKK